MAVVNHPVTTALNYKVATVTAAVVGAADTDTLSDQISEITLVPSSQSASWTSVNGKTIQDQGIATWALTLGMIQDVATTGMLRWLLTNEGKKCVFTMLLTTGVTATITAVISPAQIGGPVQPGSLTSTVTLACDGKPVFS